MALSCSIPGTYYVLSTNDSVSIFTIFFSALSIQAIGFYTIPCEHIFRTPGNMESYKRNCLIVLNDMNHHGGVTVMDLNARRSKVNAMVRPGISDGGFRDLESMNTLLFIDFYVNNVISLLLMQSQTI